MKTYAFIGVGNMASAIIKGLGDDCRIVLCDRDTSKYDQFRGEKYSIAENAADAIGKADFTVFAVKPQNMSEVLAEIAEAKPDFTGKTIISIAAGVKISTITDALGDIAVVRTMPNTPLMIGEGVTALCRNGFVADEAFDDVVGMFGKIGKTVVMPESDLNAIISATSSAPAYVYLFIKAICDGAKAQGLDYPEMTELVCAMVKGSADMVLQSEKTPDELIRMVTSPNGTTERAMKVLYERDMTGMILEAMLACTKRANELSGN